MEIGEWLEVLDLGDFSYQQFKNSEMFQDPYRNGILFAKLFCFLEKLDMFGLSAFPQNIAECSRNLMKVFSAIRQKRTEIPRQLLTVNGVEEILKGNRAYIFTILVYLKSMYGHGECSQELDNYLKREEENYQVKIGLRSQEYAK